MKPKGKNRADFKFWCIDVRMFLGDSHGCHATEARLLELYNAGHGSSQAADKLKKDRDDENRES
jgi:hypothetical protein